MRVEADAVRAGHEAGPVGERPERVAVRDERALASAGCVADEVVRLGVVPLDVLHPDRGAGELVRDPEHGHDVAVLGLANELGEHADVVERALRVRVAHRPVQHVHGALLARVEEA
jgi:hypothetical protein